MKTENSNNDNKPDGNAELRALYVRRSKEINAMAEEKRRPLNPEETKMLKELSAAIAQIDRGKKPETEKHRVIIVGPKDRDF